MTLSRRPLTLPLPYAEWKIATPLEFSSGEIQPRPAKPITASERAARIGFALDEYGRATVQRTRACAAGALALELVTCGPLAVGDFSAPIMHALRVSALPWYLVSPDFEGRIQDAGIGLARLVGEPLRWLLGTQGLDLFDPEWHPIYLEAAWPGYARGEARFGSFRTMAKTGREVLHSAAPVFNGSLAVPRFGFVVLMPVQHLADSVRYAAWVRGGQPATVRARAVA